MALWRNGDALVPPDVPRRPTDPKEEKAHRRTSKTAQIARHELIVGAIVPLVALLSHGGNPSIILPI